MKIRGGKWMLFISTLMMGKLWAQNPEVVVHVGHTSTINAVAFSPDGKYILTGSSDNTAILWDIYGREVQNFIGHGDGVVSLAFSPDGSKILTGSLDGSAILWNLNGRELKKSKGLSTSPNRLDVFYLRNSVAFSPDGSKVLAVKGDRPAMLWDLNGGKTQYFGDYGSQVLTASFSPDDSKILTVSLDGIVKLWSLNKKKLKQYRHIKGERLFAFSPDGNKIMAATNMEVKLLDITQRGSKRLRKISIDNSGVRSIIMSPDGNKFLTLHKGSSIAILWDLHGRKLQSFGSQKDEVSTVAFSPDGSKILAGCWNGTAVLWDLDGRKLQSFSSQSLKAQSVAFSPDGSKILTGCKNGTAILWSLNSLKSQVYSEHSKSETPVAFSSDGSKILTAGKNNTILWDLNGQKLQHFGGDFGYWANSVAFSPDDSKILTGGNGADLWALNGQKLGSFCIGEDVTAVAFSPNGQQILLGFEDVNESGDDILAPEGADLLDLNGRHLQFFNHRDDVHAVAFSPDGKQILIGGKSGAEMWDLDGQMLQSFVANGWVYSVAFSPDGKQVLTAGDSRSFSNKTESNQPGEGDLWDLNGRHLQSFRGHKLDLTSVAFSPDGSLVLTASDDHTSKLWEVSTGKNLLTFICSSDGSESRIVINPDQYYSITQKIPDFFHFKMNQSAYNYDQFDLRLNRPDKIMETLLPFGADSNLMLQYRQAYYKRLEKYGFTEDMLSDDFHVPECYIQNQNDIPISTSESNLTLHIQATDSLRPLVRLNVFVNDVPIYGIQGINLRGENTQAYTTTLDIPLSRGSNKIQISALNQGGAESLKATTYITYDAPERQPDLYLITIGASDYQAEGKDLQYAAKDARDIAALYQSAEGFREVHTKTLTDAQVTKTNILALKDWLNDHTQVDDQVLLYVSGHGLLDDNYDFYYATHDIDFANPAEKGILYDDIEGLLDGIPARKKLLLMDACHSGEYDKDAPPLTPAQQDSLAEKGVSFAAIAKGDGEGTPVLGLQNSFEMMQQLFADLRRGSGATVITSSSGVQVSFEKGEWQNGAFTYAFLYGLKTMKADANEDGQVTASEIQAFVGEYVPRLTEGLQVPTFRRENLEFDFRVW